MGRNQLSTVELYYTNRVQIEYSTKQERCVKTIRFIPTCRNQYRSEGSTVRDLSHGRGNIVIALRSLKLEGVSVDVLCSVGSKGSL